MSDAPEQKRCTVCGLVKPLDAFHRSRTSRDGHMGLCGMCRGATRGSEIGRRSPSERSERAEIKRELTVTARRAEDDAAWVADGWARLRADREALSG